VTSLEERFQIPLGTAVAALALLLLGAANVRRLAPRGRAAAALALLALVATPARGQTAAPSTASPGSAPAAAPTPAPLPFLERLLGSARGEAKLGKKAMDEKRLDDAAAHFRREIEIKPGDPIGPYNLGSALGKAGKTPEALASLETARQAGNGDLAADAAFNAGATLFRSGNYEGAAAAFRQALRLRPGDPDASFNYELCARKAEEEKKKQQQQQEDQKKDDSKEKDKRKKEGSGPTPTPSPQGGSGEDEKKRKQDREFESKAKMSREKAEQLLAAMQRADLDEQRKKIAEQKAKRKVRRDW